MNRPWNAVVHVASWLFAASCACAESAPAGIPTAATATRDAVTLVLVVGAAGEPEYGRDFAVQAERWQAAGKAAGARVVSIGAEATSAGERDHDRLAAALATEPKQSPGELWIVLIGHGTFDGGTAKFNLRGPDLSAAELAEWVKPFQRPVVVVDTSSASAPFLAAISGPNRVVITSTRSGFEQNFARFGRFLAEAIADPRSDLDKDGQVSVLEAFLMASRATTAFYKSENRLATEHPLLDDNGDGKGTPADWFKGVRAVKAAQEGAELDGPRARQICLVRSAAEQELAPAVRARRDELELKVERLRARKKELSEAQYYEQLEKLLLELAAIYGGT